MNTVSLFTAAGLMAAGLATSAQAGEVRIENAVARVVVIPENRADIQVTVEQGASGLPALRVRRQGDDVRIDGGLQRRIRNCRGSGFVADPTAISRDVTVQVADHGVVRAAEAPLVIVRTPRDVDVRASGAVWGAIGRSDSVELSAGGCGDWNVGNTLGELSVAIGGSGDVRAGTAASVDASIAGSGDVRTGAVGEAEISVAGSGDVRIASVDGPVDVSIAGSGGVRIGGGRASRLEVSIAGSGGVMFEGEAGDLQANIVGSGDVRVTRVTGRVTRRAVGSGSVHIGE